MAMQTVKKGLRLWTPEAEHLENFPGDTGTTIPESKPTKH